MTDIKIVKQLRDETGVSFSIISKALADAEGNIDKARAILKEKGAEVAAKKAGRDTDQGSIFSYIHHNKKIGAMATLLCETDFVAMNSDFQALGSDIAMQVASTNPESVEALTSQPFIKDPKMTVDQLIKDIILKLGENITIGEIARFEI